MLVELLPAHAADDPTLLHRLNALINAAYAPDERRLWTAGVTRTTPAELARLARAGELAVARTPQQPVAGVVHVHALDAQVAAFGMLAADPALRGIGVGRELVAFAEHRGAALGATAMQLELLVPRIFAHPGKERLAAWYGRLGYALHEVTTMARRFPDFAPHLATPCDLRIYRKPLSAR